MHTWIVKPLHWSVWGVENKQVSTSLHQQRPTAAFLGHTGICSGWSGSLHGVSRGVCFTHSCWICLRKHIERLAEKGSVSVTECRRNNTTRLLKSHNQQLRKCSGPIDFVTCHNSSGKGRSDAPQRWRSTGASSTRSSGTFSRSSCNWAAHSSTTCGHGYPRVEESRGVVQLGEATMDQTSRYLDHPRSTWWTKKVPHTQI